MIVPDHTQDVEVLSLHKDGSIIYKRALPISGRVTAGAVVELSGIRQAISLCQDVSSPCARRDGNRGPFNVLLYGETGEFSVLERQVKGHTNLARFYEQGVVVATSTKEDRTHLTLRDNLGKVLWERVLPGRLSAGPFVGPYGGIYVGTCMGWECQKPYRFISVTGAKELESKEEQ